MIRYALLLCCFLSVSALAAPQRIISLAPHITELLFAVGAGEQVIAVSDFSDYPAETATLPRVASYSRLNIEAILQLKPDLVIAWRTGALLADMERLTVFGIEVQYSNPILLDDIARELRWLGELSGHQQQAEQVAKEFEQSLAGLRTSYSSKPPLKVFFAMGTQPLSTVANNSWVQQILTLCAADNPFAKARSDYPQVGIEQVLQARPEVIIQGTGKHTINDFDYWQAFTTLPAVQKQQFLSVEADHIFRTTPRMLQGIHAVCEGIDKFR